MKIQQSQQTPPDDSDNPSRLPSVERGCNGKTNLGRSYVKQADRLSKKHGKRYGVYACPHCGGNHLTTRLEKLDQYAALLHISDPGLIG